MTIYIEKTIDVICKYIEAAEQEVRERVEEAFPLADEEQITTLFRDRLQTLLSNASDRNEIAAAFSEDLKAAGTSHSRNEVIQAARGLIAEVSWHPRHIEKRTGGDFGLVLVRPTIQKSFNQLIIQDGQVSALLAQAKRKLFGKACGSFTENQLTILPGKLDYTAMVLYEFLDWENRKLGPFRWRQCQGHSMNDVIGWLGKITIPKEFSASTADVIRNLERERVGTRNIAKINEFIAPPGAAAIDTGRGRSGVASVWNEVLRSLICRANSNDDGSFSLSASCGLVVERLVFSWSRRVVSPDR